MIRDVDSLGRIVIPKEWRESAGITEHSPVFMTYDEKNKKIILEKYETNKECSLCGDTESRLFAYKKGVICEECLNDIGEKVNKK